MFCGECGTKNKKNAAYCEGCGVKLKEEKEDIPTKEKKPMSKKNKILLILLVIVIACVFGLYKVGENLTNPKPIAKDYIKIVINNDLSSLYKYLNLGKDKTFVSSKIFKELYKDDKLKEEISNYKITDVEYSDLTARVKFVYTVKSGNEKTGSVKLIKETGKKYFIFDNWKVADMETSNIVLENFTIKALKGSEVEYAGIKLSKKYLAKNQSSDTIDIYVLPQVFKVKTKIKTTLENGIELESSVTPSSYNDSYTIRFDIDSLSNKQKEEIIEVFKSNLTKLYNDAIAGKTYEEVKDEYKNSGKDFEKNYTDFVTNLASGSSKLTKIEFKDIKLSDISIDENSNFLVKVRASYDYTVEYTSGEEVSTSDKSDYNYMSLILKNKDSKYYLEDIKSIGTYFYR